jgi:phosphoribosyl 1,2-cyclic phosphodiesterase
VLLQACALSLEEIDAVILTHLDTDHWNGGWARPGAPRLPVWVHRRHEAGARSLGVSTPTVFTGPFEPAGISVDPILMSHDEQGVSSFRFEFAAGGCLGYATDLGHPTPRFIEHMAGVDVLALESNYCPHMQMASGRPLFLKRRIMGGSGHLSNEQAAQAASEIRPRLHQVLLHLSRQCNTPQRAASGHVGAPYSLTVSEQHRPTGWIAVPPGPRPARRAAERMIHVQQPLFDLSPRPA